LATIVLLSFTACGLNDDEPKCVYANRTNIVEEGTPKVVNICLEYETATP
jgi:hypothetical protein